jgi:hypothetical protein
MQRRWQVLEQEGDRVLHGLGAHEVVVVQDQQGLGRQGSPIVEQADDRNEKDRVASSASQANQAGEPTASPASSPAAAPWRCPSATEGMRHPLPRPDPAPDIPNAPNTTLMVEGQAQSVGTRRSPGNMARCQAEAPYLLEGNETLLV